MKILFCTAEYKDSITGSGGVARMITGMADEKVSIDVISEDALYNSRGVGGIIQRLPLANYFIRSIRLGRLVRNAMSVSNYDVIFFNDVWLAAGVINFLREGVNHRIIVAFMHDDNTLNWNGERALTGRWLSFRVRAFLERRVVRGLDALLVNSEYLKQLVSIKYPTVRNYRLYYTAIDYAELTFRYKSIHTNEVINILFVKSDFDRGGLAELLRALRMLKEFKLKLTIVGPSGKQLRRKLSPLLSSSGHVEIQMTGPVLGTENMKNLFRSHDIVCVPSRKEALGLVNAEALAMGVPVVTCGVGGILEVMDNGKCGQIARSTNAVDIAEAIKTCIVNAQDTKLKTEYGREFVLNRFDVDTMYENLKGIFGEVFSAKRAGESI